MQIGLSARFVSRRDSSGSGIATSCRGKIHSRTGLVFGNVGMISIKLIGGRFVVRLAVRILKPRRREGKRWRGEVSVSSQEVSESRG